MFCCGRPRIGPGETCLLFDFQLSMAKGCSSKHGQGQLPEYVSSLYIGAHKVRCTYTYLYISICCLLNCFAGTCKP